MNFRPHPRTLSELRELDRHLEKEPHRYSAVGLPGGQGVSLIFIDRHLVAARLGSDIFGCRLVMTDPSVLASRARRSATAAKPAPRSRQASLALPACASPRFRDPAAQCRNFRSWAHSLDDAFCGSCARFCRPVGETA